MMTQPNGAKSDQVITKLRETGGADIQNLTIRVIVEGHRNQQIRILNVRPLLLARATPLKGTLFFSPPQEGSPSTLRMMFNLDEPTPVAHESIQNEKDGYMPKPGPPFFENSTITLNDGEQQVLMIRTKAEQHYVAFNLAIDYRIGDYNKTLVISNHGQPFRITGMNYGSSRDIWSYQRAFNMTNDYSYCSVINPHTMSTLSDIPCA